MLSCFINLFPPIFFTLKKISTYDSLFSQLKYLVKYSWREGESFSQIDKLINIQILLEKTQKRIVKIVTFLQKWL